MATVPRSTDPTAAAKAAQLPTSKENLALTLGRNLVEFVRNNPGIPSMLGDLLDDRRATDGISNRSKVFSDPEFERLGRAWLQAGDVRRGNFILMARQWGKDTSSIEIK